MARVSPRLISLSIGGASRNAEVAKAAITSTPSDRHRLGEPEPDRDYALTMKIAQDHADGSLWSLVWANAGGTVDGVYRPYGNPTPTTTSPHYSFTAVVVEPSGDLMGSEAVAKLNAVAAVEVTWPLLAKPTKVTA